MSLSNAILSRPGTCRGLVVSVLVLLSAGCGETSQSPEDPTILGVPPDTAYLGVDYSYNFGAAGGDALLNYSLSNNPSWLALETTTNKARPGIVLRGQPGITGGRNGEEDLGLNESIRITSNDGQLLGDREFEIEVQHNALTIVTEPITEGRAHTPDVDKDDDAMCEIPDMSVIREVDVEHENLRSGDDDIFAVASRTYTTRPALLRVDLDQPSVEPVSVKFRVFETNPRAEVGPNDDTCKQNENEPCEYQEGNRTKAIFGEDFLLNGNSGNYEVSEPFPEPPDYIEFINETDGEGTGLLTFEPGQTSCFIPIWVHEDDLAERTERFGFELTEVTEGLATLDGSGANPDARPEIEDNTPTVSFEEERLVVTRGDFRSVTARLDRPNDTGEVLRAGVEWVEEQDFPAADLEACFPTPDDVCPLIYDSSIAEDEEQSGSLTIEFPPGEQEAEFFLRAKSGSADPDPLEEDETFEIGFSDEFQFGREFAAIGSNETTEVTVNEWGDDLTTAFDLETLVAGAVGEIYAAGTDNDGALQVRSINRLGNADYGTDTDSVNLSDNGGSWPDPSGPIELAFNSRDTNTSSSPELTRYLGLGYSSGQDAGTRAQLALFSSVIEEDGGGLVREPGAELPNDLQWQYGTDEDGLGTFHLGGIAISNEGDLSIGASGQNGDPIRLIQVDNNTDGSDPQPDLRWTQSENTGGANTVIGVVSSGLAGFSAVGSTLGTVAADDAVGMEDFFLLGVQTDGSIDTRAQFGSDETDTVSTVAGGSTRVWLGGNGQVRYELDDFDNIDANSPAGDSNAFVLVTSGTGSVQAVRNFAGSDKEPVPASVDALDASGNSAIAAGSSVNSGVPYLSRLDFSSNADDDEERISLAWRIEVEGAEEVLDVSSFDERKIFVAYRKSGGGTAIRLYDLHGNRLSQ